MDELGKIRQNFASAVKKYQVFFSFSRCLNYHNQIYEIGLQSGLFHSSISECFFRIPKMKWTTNLKP